jgi:hypothetical protein
MFTGPMTRLRNTGGDGLDARFVSQVALLSWRCTSGACRGSVKGSCARFEALPFKYPVLRPPIDVRRCAERVDFRRPKCANDDLLECVQS